MEMRVEELARRAGTSVDTVRYYQTKRLIPPPRRQGRVALYGDDHLQRIRRVRSLQARGFRLGTIARLVGGGLDAADEALVAEVSGIPHAPDAPASPARHHAPDRAPTVGDDGMLSLADLAARASVPLPLLAAIESEGLLVPRRIGARDVYTEEDVAIAGHALVLLEWGIPLSDLLDLARRHHVATVALAEDAVRLFSTSVRPAARARAGREETGMAGNDSDNDGMSPSAFLVRAYTELLAAVTGLVAHHFTRVLLRTALDHIEDVGSRPELEAIHAHGLELGAIHEHGLGGVPPGSSAAAS